EQAEAEKVKQFIEDRMKLLRNESNMKSQNSLYICADFSYLNDSLGDASEMYCESKPKVKVNQYLLGRKHKESDAAMAEAKPLINQEPMMDPMRAFYISHDSMLLVLELVPDFGLFNKVSIGVQELIN